MLHNLPDFSLFVNAKMKNRQISITFWGQSVNRVRDDRMLGQQFPCGVCNRHSYKNSTTWGIHIKYNHNSFDHFYVYNDIDVLITKEHRYTEWLECEGFNILFLFNLLFARILHLLNKPWWLPGGIHSTYWPKTETKCTRKSEASLNQLYPHRTR